MPLIKQLISKLNNVLVDPFNCIASNHKILIFVFSLFYACNNFFDIIPLMLRLSNKHDPPLAIPIENLRDRAIWPDAGTIDKYRASQTLINGV